MDIFVGVLQESYQLSLRMAPFLLFGFFFAGVLHIFIRTETIAKHLGTGSFAAVLKASLFGIPLPLCSCGVIPAAQALRKEGASKGAVLSFLISTPTTGIDSILATVALLGWFFAGYRILATFSAALFVGLLANFFSREPVKESIKKKEACAICAEEHHASRHGVLERLKSIFVYGFLGSLFRESIRWMIMGIFIGGTISYFLPAEFIENYLGSGAVAIIVMFFIGTPMYICASGSIPIAASLLAKGLNPGAAFAFLLAGPATNTVTIAMVAQSLGKKALCIYLAAIFGASLFFGMLFDWVLQLFGGIDPADFLTHAMHIPLWIEQSAAVLLVILMCVNQYRRK
jgi:uncharacterized protein